MKRRRHFGVFGPSRPNGGDLIAIALCGLGLVLLVASISTPWYQITSNHSDHGTISVVITSDLISNGVGSNEYRVHLITLTIVLSAIAISVIFLVSLIWMALSRRPGRRYPVAFVAVTLVIMTLLGPVYFASALPGAKFEDHRAYYTHHGNEYIGPLTSSPENSFWGKGTDVVYFHYDYDVSPDTTTFDSAEWGPGVGYYLSIISAVFFILSSIVAAINCYLRGVRPAMGKSAPVPHKGSGRAREGKSASVGPGDRDGMSPAPLRSGQPRDRDLPPPR